MLVPRISIRLSSMKGRREKKNGTTITFIESGSRKIGSDFWPNQVKESNPSS